MATWRYFLSGDTPDRADEGRAGLIRSPVGAGVANAETLLPSGDWRLSDVLYKQKYQGSDHEAVEIDEDRAQRLIRRWVEIGRIAKRPSDESSIPPELAARLDRVDEQAAAIWRAVPVPPGATEIQDPG